MKRYRRISCALPAALLITSLLRFVGCDARHLAAIEVGAGSARACDVLVDVGEASSSHVEFGDGARGALSQKGPRLGISWAAATDHSFTPVALTVQGGRGPKLLTSSCYDAGGRPIANPKVTLR